MFGNHGLCGLTEEGTHGKSPKCSGGNLGDFGGILQRSQIENITKKIRLPICTICVLTQNLLILTHLVRETFFIGLSEEFLRSILLKNMMGLLGRTIHYPIIWQILSISLDKVAGE